MRNSTFFRVIFNNYKNDAFVPAKIKQHSRHNGASQCSICNFCLWSGRHDNRKGLVNKNRASSAEFVSVDVARFCENKLFPQGNLYNVFNMDTVIINCDPNHVRWWPERTCRKNITRYGIANLKQTIDEVQWYSPWFIAGFTSYNHYFPFSRVNNKWMVALVCNFRNWKLDCYFLTDIQFPHLIDYIYKFIGKLCCFDVATHIAWRVAQVWYFVFIYVLLMTSFYISTPKELHVLSIALAKETPFVSVCYWLLQWLKVAQSQRFIRLACF